MPKTTRCAAIVGLAISAAASSAHAQLRVCSWNITNYTSGRINEFQTSIYGVVPALSAGGQPMALAGQRMAPDIILAQEIRSAAGIINFRNLLNSAPGSPGDWAATNYIDAPGGDTSFAMFYRTNRVLLVQNTTIISQGAVDTDGVAPHIPPRNTERYVVRLAGYNDIATTNLALYNSHMKSGSGVDELRRQTEAQRIAADVLALTPGWHAILGGDFNCTGFTDGGFAPLVGAVNGNPAIQNGPLYDPIRALGGWENNGTFRFIHTQDPGAGKQMDSRFDFVLLSASLRDGVGLDYIGSLSTPWNLATFNDTNHSYRCWGNDGSSFNTSLNIASNTMVGNAIATALQLSAVGLGHLPVYLDLRVPAKAQASTTTINFGNVPQNSTQSLTFTVGNSGDVSLWTVGGIAPLNYSYPAPGSGFTVTQAGAQQTDAPGGGVNTHTVTLDTTTAGPKAGSLIITTNAPENPTITIALAATVGPGGPTRCGRSDIAGPGLSVGFDGETTADDIILFVSWFTSGDLRADFSRPGLIPEPDGELTADDVITFIGFFTISC